MTMYTSPIIITSLLTPHSSKEEKDDHVVRERGFWKMNISREELVIEMRRLYELNVNIPKEYPSIHNLHLATHFKVLEEIFSVGE